MKRMIVLLILIAGCRGKSALSPGSDAVLRQGDPARQYVMIVVPPKVIRAPVGTRVTVVGPPPVDVPTAEPYLCVTVREGEHAGAVGFVAVRFLEPSR